MLGPLPLFGGLPGGPELLVILLIAVLLFGANKIPKLARSTGEAMGEFQKGREEVEQELQEMREGGGGRDSRERTGNTEPAGDRDAGGSTGEDSADREGSAETGIPDAEGETEEEQA